MKCFYNKSHIEFPSQPPDARYPKAVRLDGQPSAPCKIDTYRRRKGQGDAYTKEKAKSIHSPVYDPTSTLKWSTYLFTYIFHLPVLNHVGMQFILTGSNEQDNSITSK
jgi:hypothetical protein